MSELARAAGVDSESVEGAAILSDIFRAAFGDHVPEGQREYARFRRHLRVVKAKDDEYVKAIGACVEAFASFPTSRPSASQPSPSPTTGGSRGGGSSPGAPVIQGQVVVEEEPDDQDQDEDDQEPVAGPGATVVNIGRRAS